MPPFALIMKGLTRNWIRTILTVLAITVALFLFSTLQSVLTSFDRSVEVLGESRLITRNKISLIFPLPLSYHERISSVEGVDAVTYGNWFGGQYSDRPQSFFSNFAVDPAAYLDMYPEIVLTDGEKRAFIEERTACIVGERLAEEFGWSVGDDVTLSGTIYPGEWNFTIRGIYRAGKRGFDPRTLYFHWDYMNESLPEEQQGLPGFYVIRLESPDAAARVVEAVDATFENSPSQTLTETEKAFQLGFITMMGNIKALVYIIGIAVVFAMVLVAANTMIMAGRERTRELATMKTLGFDDDFCHRLLLSESLLVAVSGGVLGTVVAKLIFDAVGFTMGGFFPDFTVEWRTVGIGMAIAVAVGFVAGMVPARRARKLRIVEALRSVG